ncbi:MAG: hypothetical protein ACOY45_05215 [Pseudomonadota bacterium]
MEHGEKRKRKPENHFHSLLPDPWDIRQYRRGGECITDRKRTRPIGPDGPAPEILTRISPDGAGNLRVPGGPYYPTENSEEDRKGYRVVPPITAPCWQRLATGGLKSIRTDNIGTSLLAKRIENSPAPIHEKVREIHEYYSKWERGLANEIAQFA